MSQTTMDKVMSEAAGMDLARLERERLAALRWESWGREIGLLTPEHIARNNNPSWAWDDYSI